ncbi:MAG TPA: LD-carboxypeptidase [Flavobacteriales bacterium]|nr:LD-carboxypeptidase [Flavobacteriales bacterium]
MTTIVPPPLVTGDTIAIIPTARSIAADELAAGVALAESWGLKVRLGAGVGRKHFQQAGTTAERTADLQAAIDDPSVKAIWCARGGYGTVHLLDGLDTSPLHRDPKWIVGFSDITVLHNALHGLGVASLHAQMPFNIAGKSEACKETLRQALFGEPFTVSGGQGHRTGTSQGVLVGGNLSLLYALRGTPYDIDPRGKILFLEDLDELRYHMDRMIQNLKLGGWFRDLEGLIIGGMTDMRDKNPDDPFGKEVEDMINEACASQTYPVCYGFPAGHLDDNRALVMGAKAKLSVTANGATLSFGDVVG